MTVDINSWTRQCIACHMCKTTKQVGGEIGVLHLSTKRFRTIHLDFIDSLRSSHGFQYWHIIINKFTWQPKAIPLGDFLHPLVPKSFVEGLFLASVGWQL